MRSFATALFIFVTPLSSQSVGRWKCVSALQREVKQVREFDFSVALSQQGLDLDKISFRVQAVTFGDGEGLLVWLRHSGERGARIAMRFVPWKAHFTSHVYVDDEYRGKELEILLSVLGAKLAHEIYGATLGLNQNTSIEEQKIWGWIVDHGWARKSLLRKHHFDSRIVADQFDDLYSFFWSRIEGEPPARHWLISPRRRWLPRLLAD